MPEQTIGVFRSPQTLQDSPSVAVNSSTATLAAALGRVSSIACNTFREAVRDRVLYNLVLFALLLTACAVFVGELSAAQEAKIIVDLGLSATLVFGAFIAIFVGTNLVYKEIERRTVFAIFAKPIGRGEFLIGKYLGLCLTLTVNITVMGVGIALALAYIEGGWHPLTLSVFPALAMLLMEMMILTGVALLFSTFSSPALTALFSFGVFIIGNYSEDLRLFAESLGTGGAKLFFNVLYFLLPNFGLYSWISAAASGRAPSASEFALALLYTLAYVAVLLAAATLIFRRRNFK